MTRSVQTRALLLLGGVAVLIGVLASSLAAIDMRPGSPLPLPGLPTATGASALAPAGEVLLLVFRAALAILLVLLPVYLIVNLLTVAGRRRLLGNLLSMLLVMGLAVGLANLAQLSPFEPTAQQEAQLQELEDLAGQALTMPAFIAQMPDWLTPVAIVLMSVAAAGVVFIGLRQLRGTGRVTPAPLPDLAGKVQTALDELEAGADMGDVITRCYRQMSTTLREARGIQRGAAMTTTEFEHELRERGFPARPIEALTRLFEQVRYSRQTASEADRRLASESLEAFLTYCRQRSA